MIIQGLTLSNLTNPSAQVSAGFRIQAGPFGTGTGFDRRSWGLSTSEYRWQCRPSPSGPDSSLPFNMSKSRDGCDALQGSAPSARRRQTRVLSMSPTCRLFAKSVPQPLSLLHHCRDEYQMAISTPWNHAVRVRLHLIARQRSSHIAIADQFRVVDPGAPALYPMSSRWWSLPPGPAQTLFDEGGLGSLCGMSTQMTRNWA